MKPAEMPSDLPELHLEVVASHRHDSRGLAKPHPRHEEREDGGVQVRPLVAVVESKRLA